MRDAGLQPLIFKYFFLINEDLIEINLMYFFVGIVDAKLLKTVPFKHLKPVNIQKFNLFALREIG